MADIRASTSSFPAAPSLASKPSSSVILAFNEVTVSGVVFVVAGFNAEVPLFDTDLLIETDFGEEGGVTVADTLVDAVRVIVGAVEGLEEAVVDLADDVAAFDADDRGVTEDTVFLTGVVLSFAEATVLVVVVVRLLGVVEVDDVDAIVDFLGVVVTPGVRFGEASGVFKEDETEVAEVAAFLITLLVAFGAAVVDVDAEGVFDDIV
jgi:hypothetical protein